MGTNGIKTGAIYSTHHINAYEVTENELETVVVDLVIPPWYALKNFTDKDIMLNTEDTGSMENLFEIRRYQIDIHNERAFSSSWENNAPEAQPYYNQFDFPKVNPNYYGRHYCYAYGQAIVDVRRQYLVIKTFATRRKIRSGTKRSTTLVSPSSSPTQMARLRTTES